MASLVYLKQEPIYHPLDLEPQLINVFSQTGGANANNEFEFSLVFDTCPITITAVDPDTNQSYQFTSNFDSMTKTFTCGSMDEDKGDKGEVERELLNSDGNQVGYLIFDFLPISFKWLI